MTHKQNSTNIEAQQKSYAPVTVGKVLQLMECFSIAEPELSAPELGKKLKLPTSTLYRYLQSMEDEGFLTRDPDSNRYSVGLYIVELAGIALGRYEVRRVGQSTLDELSAKLKMNTNMGILYKGDLFHLAFSIQTPVESYYTILGRRTPAHLTAMGKMLLAQLPFEEVCSMINKNGWCARTPYSISGFDRLTEELEQIKKLDYSVDRRESSLSTCCIAAPVRQRNGHVIAAISATTQDTNFEKEFDDMKNAVCDAALQISTKLGYMQEHFYNRRNF